MFAKKKTFVEVCFTERELDILKEAEKIITNLIESNDGDFCNQQTGEVIPYTDLKTTRMTLMNFSYCGASTAQLFEIIKTYQNWSDKNDC